jgi:hypothetical protein
MYDHVRLHDYRPWNPFALPEISHTESDLFLQKMSQTILRDPSSAPREHGSELRRLGR